MKNSGLTLRKVRVEQLRLSNRLSAKLWAQALDIESRLRSPKALTVDAIQLLARLHPVHVVDSDRGNRKFDVIANHAVANLALRLPLKSKLQVLVWSENEIASPQESMFLSYLLFGLGAGQQRAVLRLYESLTQGQRDRLSPRLKSRSDLERLTGVSRKIGLQDLAAIAKDDQIGLGF
ncbi:hypothetical protein ASQ50_13400 [Marinobacter sp. LQ44]|nr:hypothetical protein ASQ50_13400 [Marinobacter sp. LQ44]